MLFSVIITLIAFGIMVLLHEAGHFFAAKLFGVTVHEFSVGMGPLALSKTKGGTQYSLRWLPVGGYVKLEGEGEESSDPKAFSNIHPLKRIVILASGAAMNVLLGFLCFVVLISAVGSVTTSSVGYVVPGSPAEKCGIEAGDRIFKLDGTRVDMRSDIDLFMMEDRQMVRVSVKRGGEKLVFDLEPEDGKLGIVPLGIEPNAFETVKYSYFNTRYVVRAVVVSLKMLFTGEAGVRDLSGPVGIVKVVDEATDAVAETEGAPRGMLPLVLLNLFAMISVNLGVFNLLPFPALDGGSIIFALSELVLRKRLNPDIIGYINFAGLVLIFGLGIVVMGSDVMHLFGR